MERHSLLKIEIVYASQEAQQVLDITVSEPCTVFQAIIQSKVLELFPEIDLKINKVGIFAKIVSLDTLLKSKDRIEIYRALLIDPKQARKKRAKQLTHDRGRRNANIL